MKAANYDLRIIPARAGFTDVPFFQANQYKDHPRSRGVYPARRARRAASPGSSPLARGLLDGLGGGAVVGGIIPARAGFTSLGTVLLGRPQDHPRSRGVYDLLSKFSAGTSGSSPLARGLHVLS